MARDENVGRARRRSGGRGAKSAAAASQSAIKQLPRGSVKNPVSSIEPLSADQIETIHHASLRILSDVGMEVLGDDAKAVFKAAGVDVKPDTDLIKFDPAFIEEAIFIGDDQLETLVEIKSREELIGEIIGLLQSPAKNVISALKSGGGTLSGILKTLSEKEG